jgi:ribosomal protein S18 acetylase RimI-like enzyme
MTLQISYATAEQAPLVHSLVQAAFAEYEGKLAAPPGALKEPRADVERDIEEGRALLAWDRGEAVGTVRYKPYPDYLYVGRLAVLPTRRGEGIGAALMQYLEQEIAPSLGLDVLRLSTRISMPGNLAFYKRIGYEVEGEEPHSSGKDTVVLFIKRLVGGQS